MIYSLSEWQKLAGEIMSRPISDARVRDFRRRVFAGAVDLEPDRQGRILLPPYLRDFAAINDEVVVVGMYNYIEIWNTEAWNGVRQNIEESSDSERWANLGF